MKVKIGELGKVVTGKTPSTKDIDNFGNDYMFISPSDLHNNFMLNKSEKNISKKGFNSIKSNTIDGVSVLVGCIGWDMGNVIMTNKKCATNQQINSITEFNDNVNPYYVYYWLKNKKEYLFQIANVTRTPILNKSDFSNIEIDLPNLETQNKIADILSTIDEKIENNNKINAELESMAKTIYDYWFLQFDFPDENGKPYKSSGGAMVWNEQLKKDIPKGWKVKKIEDYCKIFTGKKDVKQALEQGKYKFFSCAPNYKYSNDKLFEGKAILISGNGSYTGRTIFVDDAFDLYQRTYACVNNTKKEYIEYIFYTMLKFFVPIVSGGTHGSAIPYIVFDDIAKQKILINDLIINKFQSKIIPIQNKINQIQKENQELANLRDWLLPLLMNGQVGFKDN